MEPFSFASTSLNSSFNFEPAHTEGIEVPVVSFSYEEPVVENDRENRAIEFAQASSSIEARIAETMKILAEQYSPKLSPATKEQADVFLLTVLPKQINEFILLLNNINFSRSYEKLTRTYPTTTEFKPFVDKALEIQKQFNNFIKIEGFEKKFDDQMSLFLHMLKLKICTQAKESRLAQKKAILAKELIVEDEEFDLICIDAHLDACDHQSNYYWLELRNLLNLQQNNNCPRECTRKELNMFMFLSLIFDRLTQRIQET